MATATTIDVDAIVKDCVNDVSMLVRSTIAGNPTISKIKLMRLIDDKWDECQDVFWHSVPKELLWDDVWFEQTKSQWCKANKIINGYILL